LQAKDATVNRRETDAILRVLRAVWRECAPKVIGLLLSDQNHKTEPDVSCNGDN
jgi:hypothetical protein